MRIQLSASDQAIAKEWITVLFASSPKYNTLALKWIHRSYIPVHLTRFPNNDSNLLAEEIITRQFNFVRKDLDRALDNCCAQWFFSPISGYKMHRKPAQAAQYIAYFCKRAGIYWDDSNTTTYELDEIKGTLLGKTLYDNGCFASTANNAPATTKTASTRTAGQPPVNGYKASGPHSQDIPNLIGTPNNKIYLSGKVYAIIADKIGKNTPNAYITPLKTSTTQIIKIGKADAEKVRMGSGNGYTDCMLWFDDLNIASTFATNCVGMFGGKFNNIRIVSDKASSNGYFKVSTDLGDAFIKANKLNEKLFDNNEESKELVEDASMDFKINDVYQYADWTHRSIS